MADKIKFNGGRYFVSAIPLAQDIGTSDVFLELTHPKPLGREYLYSTNACPECGGHTWVPKAPSGTPVAQVYVQYCVPVVDASIGFRIDQCANPDCGIVISGT